jgi:hypothetical protein
MKSRKSTDRGSALVAVIWFIAILALASVAALTELIRCGSSKINGFRAQQLAEMGNRARSDRGYYRWNSRNGPKRRMRALM